MPAWANDSERLREQAWVALPIGGELFEQNSLEIVWGARGPRQPNRLSTLIEHARRPYQLGFCNRLC
jgi:hypothetical protein